MIETKKCTKCGEIKLIDEFTFRKDTKKYRTECKICRNIYFKKYDENRKKTPERQAYVKDYTKSKKYKEYDKARNQLPHRKEYNRKNGKKYRQNNPGKIKRNAEQKNKRNIQSKQQRNNPEFKLRHDISGSVYRALKKCNSSKNRNSSLNYLPYTLLELRNYIEKLFNHPQNLTPNGDVWMNWKNHGNHKINEFNINDPLTWKWQLDHIIPHSLLPYDSMDHPNFQLAWALSNLRPLRSDLNNSKHDKLLSEEEVTLWRKQAEEIKLPNPNDYLDNNFSQQKEEERNEKI